MWDYDNDGDLDIVVSHVDLQGTPVLLRNDGGNAKHWFGVTLVGRNPAASTAAKATLVAGDLTQVRVNQLASGYLSYGDPRLHFGMGDRTRVDRLTVRWADGSEEVFTDLPIDQYVKITQGGERVREEKRERRE